MRDGKSGIRVSRNPDVRSANVARGITWNPARVGDRELNSCRPDRFPAENASSISGSV